MKRTLILLFITALISGCIYVDDEPYDVVHDNNQGYQWSQYEPVIVKRELFPPTTQLIGARDIINSGKIYIKDNLLFVSEVNEGFHVFDNSDPVNPIKKAFLKVLGSSDLSIKDNSIYINNAVDLIAVKPNDDLTKIEITKRVKNVFPQLASPEGYLPNNLKEDEIIVNWIKKKK